jgi:hypothetical protein
MQKNLNPAHSGPAMTNPDPQNTLLQNLLQLLSQEGSGAPVASKVLTPGRVGRERLEKVVDSKRMTPATGRNADEPKDS